MARAQKAKTTADGGSKDHTILYGAEKTSSHSRNAKAKLGLGLGCELGSGSEHLTILGLG